MKLAKIDWNVVKDLKFELIIWSLTHYSIFHLLVILPFTAGGYMNIFLGMNIEIPTLTKWLFTYSSFILCWKLILIPIILCILLLTWGFGIKIMHQKACSILEKDCNKYIQFQFKILAGLLLSYLMIGGINSFFTNALITPMLRLVNAT